MVEAGIPPRRIRIGVVGERETTPRLWQAAQTVGREIARRGGILICGGMGGVMEAASKGAREAGGVVVGILPTDSERGANPYLTIPIPTGMGEGRNVLVVRASQALIAIGGWYGTLVEIAYALALKVPVVGLHTWRIERPGLEHDPILRAGDPVEAVEMAWCAAVGGRSDGFRLPPG
ncbi:MAG: TIGR00725 family protein [Armatimonadetes bacterium]|nr:TIGR00725 family protein [Armatimonadota bacterium]MDW8154338.1 TIGR00725 family protein [Armatimonadota bacterium]